MTTKPQIACEMKVREINKYSDKPSTYEVLLFTRGGRSWHFLCMDDGTRALFNRPPANEEEARETIREFERQRNVLEPA